MALWPGGGETMNDQFTEISHTSWGSRIGGSIKGILFGLLLLAGAVVLLFWNEGRAVQTAKSLTEGAAAVQSVAAQPVDPALEGKLIHITGPPVTKGSLRDPAFGVTVQALRLKRIAQMYQWGEETHTKTEKKVGGGEVKTTTYNYRKEWSERPIDSGRFHHPEGHRNPGIMPYRSQTLTAGGVTLGAFKLSSQQVAQVDAFQPLALSKDNHQPPADLKAQSQESGLYLGQNSADPQVGDQKVSFQVVPLTTLSVVGVQKGSSLAPFEAKAGDSIMMVWAGEHSAASMFKQAQSANRTLGWVLRLVGLVLMVVGLVMLLRPISVVLDVLPILGNIAGAGLGIIAVILGLSISLVVIGIAWIYYRPVMGVGLLVAAVALLVGLKMLRSKKKPAPVPAGAGGMGMAPPPPPPPPGA